MLKGGLDVVFKTFLRAKPHIKFSSQTNTEKWDLITAVCLERKPVITPLLTEFEQKFQSLIREDEHQQSVKSDHELRHEIEIKQQESFKKGDTEMDVSLKETAQDFVDRSNEELAQFKFGSRLTDADKTNDVQSLNRKLDKYLVLLVNQKLGQKNYYLLPQGLRQDGETLRQTAERVLQETCGTNIKAQFYGNAPSGVYKYKYPKIVQEQNNAIGAKIFIYLAKHCGGGISNKEIEYKWLDKKELKKELNKDYHNSLAQFLIDEH